MGAPSLDSNLAGIFKVWYTDKSPEDVFFRNSPVVKKIPKTKIGGKTYNVPLLLGNGGSASGNFLTSTANATANGSAPNVEFVIDNGQIFSTFFITNREILASQNIRGAYMPVAVNRMAQGLDAFRKLVATSLYGTGFGEIGQMGTSAAAVNIAASTGQALTFTSKSMVMKLSLGSVVSITNGATPGSTLRTGKMTVTGIDGLTVTFTSDTAIGTTTATDWVCLDGCRNSTAPLLPVGLGGWLPSIANRTGGTWTSYIGTSFFGVTRNVNVQGAAGQFILRDSGNSEKKVDAIVRGVEAVRTAGGLPDILVINSTDYAKIIVEMNAQTTYFQNINTGSKPNKNEVAKGISDMKYAFSTTWVDEVWDDPFCPEGVAYILESDTLEFACLTNSEAPLNDGISGNDPGKEALTDVKAPEANYYWLIEDYITSQPGGNTMNGPALQVIVQLFGAWVVHNPSKCAVLSIA
jgi:hypothetical protein